MDTPESAGTATVEAPPKRRGGRPRKIVVPNEPTPKPEATLVTEETGNGYSELPLPVPNGEREPIFYAVYLENESRNGGGTPAILERQTLPLYNNSGLRVPTGPNATIEKVAAAALIPRTDAQGVILRKKTRAWRLIKIGNRSRIRFEDPEVAVGRGARVRRLRLWCPLRMKNPDLETPEDHGSYDGRSAEFLPLTTERLREKTTKGRGGTQPDPEARIAGACPDCVNLAEATTRDLDHEAEFWNAYDNLTRKRADMIRRLRG